MFHKIINSRAVASPNENYFAYPHSIININTHLFPLRKLISHGKHNLRRIVLRNTILIKTSTYTDLYLITSV